MTALGKKIWNSNFFNCSAWNEEEKLFVFIYWVSAIKLLSVKGSFMNDITHLGGGGCHFCEVIYEALSKTFNLFWQKGERFRKSSKLAWHHLWMASTRAQETKRLRNTGLAYGLCYCWFLEMFGVSAFQELINKLI